MTEVLKIHFDKSEFQKVEQEIQKDDSFKEIYERIKNDPDYKMTKLEEKIDKTEENFEKRFKAFKDAVLEAEKKQGGNIIENAKTKIESELKEKKEKLIDELRKKADEKIPYIWSYIFDFASDLMKPSEEKKPWLFSKIFWKIGVSIWIWILWWLWLKEWFEKYSDMKAKEPDLHVNWVDNIKEIWNEITKQVIATWEQVKWEVVQTWEEVKDDIVDFNKKMKANSEKLKEKVVLEPDTIYNEFTNKYLELLVWNNWETTNLRGDPEIFNKLKWKKFDNLKDWLNWDNLKIAEYLTNDTSVNLLTPFLSSKNYLNNIIWKDYIKWVIKSERIEEIKESLKKDNFDWKNIFTLHEISLIMTQNLAYLWQAWFKSVEWYLSSTDILSNINTMDELSLFTDNLSNEAKSDINILKDTIDEKTSLKWLLDNKTNDQDFYKKDTEQNKSKRKVFEFTKSFFESDIIKDFWNDLGININLSEEMKNKFTLFNMSKLYVILNWNLDYKSWWDPEKISFITWLTTQLSSKDMDNQLWSVSSAIVEKVVMDESEQSFISKGVKNFFKSWAGILWKKFAQDEFIKPLDTISWILKNYIPKDFQKWDIWDITTKIPAVIMMWIWALIMLYPAYRITRLLTNKTLLKTIIWWSLAYAWKDYLKESWFKDTINDLSKYFWWE